jgi:peptidoglycan hydrolase-like protein with peptidoglycan-binding domain
MHNGIDLTATNDGKTGQPDYIKAHTGGVVESVGYGASAGNYIKIRVDSKTVMVYYHLREKPVFKVGETVATGQRLGYMGQTGLATAKHLHFGIQHDGEWIDPEPYLDKEWAQPTKYISLELPVLKRGMKGGSVWSLQALLLGFGYDLGDTGAKKDGVDGSFGSKTEEALKKYQYENDLDPDGSCGRKTWSELLGLE